MKNKLIKFFIILGSMLIMVVIGVKTKEYQKNKPLCKNCNVLLISLDTLSAKHLPCYGYDKNTAPNLCQFGKDNILFENSYAQSNWSRPSQTSVFTGLHSITHEVVDPYINKLAPQFKTIQEILKEAGYTTYYFGPTIDNAVWDESLVRNFDYVTQNTYQQISMEHWQEALDVLEKNQKSKTPTFIYLHTYWLHAPYVTGTNDLKFVNKEDIIKYPQIPLTQEDYYKVMKDMVINSLENRVKGSKTKESLERNTIMLNKMKATKTVEESQAAFDSLPLNEIEGYSRDWYLASIKSLNKNKYVTSLYDERIYQLDVKLKQIFDQINNKFAKDTIVIIYSDHGETTGERGSYSHCYENDDCLYNEIMRVPFIMKIPGIKNKKTSELVQSIDIYPTIIKAIGREIPPYIEGSALDKLIKYGTKIHDYIVVEEDRIQKAIIDKKWKLYFKDFKNVTQNNIELYDLENDLDEQKNVAKDNPEIVKEKIDQLKEFIDKSEDTTPQKYNFPDWIDDVKREKMINEGYF